MRNTSLYVTRFFGLSLLALLICGCVHTVTKDDLEEAGMEHAATSFPEQVYYVGSQGDYDYFVIRRPLHSARNYRVRKSEETVRNRFGRTANETEWREYGTEMVVTNSAGK